MSDFPTPGGTPGGADSGSTSGPPGPGWWQASDGNWYPPDQQPGYSAPPPPGAPGASGGPSYPGQSYGYGYPVQAAATGTNGYAIASLIASIVSCGIGSILGVIFGHMALNQMKQSGEGGRGLALAGLVLGYLGILGIIVAVIVIFAVSGSDSNDFEFQFDRIVGGWAR